MVSERSAESIAQSGCRIQVNHAVETGDDDVGVIWQSSSDRRYGPIGLALDLIDGIDKIVRTAVSIAPETMRGDM